MKSFLILEDFLLCFYSLVRTVIFFSKAMNLLRAFFQGIDSIAYIFSNEVILLRTFFKALILLHTICF